MEGYRFEYVWYTETNLQAKVLFRLWMFSTIKQYLMVMVLFGWLSMHNGFKCVGFRPDTDLFDSSPRLSQGVREQCIIAEHQRQLEREMQEMHDTVRRNALTRQRPCAWDSHSVSSWSSSIDSIAGTITFKKYRAPMWEVVKGHFYPSSF